MFRPNSPAWNAVDQACRASAQFTELHEQWKALERKLALAEKSTREARHHAMLALDSVTDTNQPLKLFGDLSLPAAPNPKWGSLSEFGRWVLETPEFNIAVTFSEGRLYGSFQINWTAGIRQPDMTWVYYTSKPGCGSMADLQHELLALPHSNVFLRGAADPRLQKFMDLTAELAKERATDPETNILRTLRIVELIKAREAVYHTLVSELDSVPLCLPLLGVACVAALDEQGDLCWKLRHPDAPKYEVQVNLDRDPTVLDAPCYEGWRLDGVDCDFYYHVHLIEDGVIVGSSGTQYASTIQELNRKVWCDLNSEEEIDND